MLQVVKDELNLRRKLMILEFARITGNVRKTCREVDVKFIWLKKAADARVRRFQYTAIDDATRIRALKVFKRHTQKNITEFVDYVIK